MDTKLLEFRTFLAERGVEFQPKKLETILDFATAISHLLGAPVIFGPADGDWAIQVARQPDGRDWIDLVEYTD